MISIALLILSAAIFAIQISIFKEDKSTLFYLLQDLAFLPVQLLIVYVILERVLDTRSRQEKIKKVSVVINVFFTEMGRDFIPLLTKFIGNYDELKESIAVAEGWNSKQFAAAVLRLQKFKYTDAKEPYDFKGLYDFLSEKKQFMLNLLQNEYLIAHDEITDMLWSLFHVLDELQYRCDLDSIPEHDIRHIMLDIRRAYIPILIVWLHYMENMKSNYPHLFRFLIKKSLD